MIDMLIQLSNKEIKEARRLGKELAIGTVPVDGVRTFLAGIQRQTEKAAASPERKTNRVKSDRKSKYRTKLFAS
jgi:hypothetical protein